MLDVNENVHQVEMVLVE